MKRLGYLSAALRVSTHPEAASGGARAHVLGVIDAFEELGWEVFPFIVGDQIVPRLPTKGELSASNGHLWRRVISDVVRLIMGQVNARRASLQLAGQVDWVYERFATLQSLGWIFQRRSIPWILETQGPFYYEAKEERNSLALQGLAKQLEIKAYRDCDVLICVTHALKDILIAEAGISPQKIVVIPNGVDVRFFDPTRYEPERLFQGFTIGFVGGLIGWQGLNILIEAISELKHEGFDIHATIVGDGKMRDAWQAMAKDLDVSDRVAFVGRVSRTDVPRYLAGFDLAYSGQMLLKMGKMYHSPLKLYEYMAMGKPVVATAFEDAKRSVREGYTGFLFPPGDKKRLKAILRDARDRYDLVEMGKRARAEIVEKHSWEVRVARMIKEIEWRLAP